MSDERVLGHADSSPAPLQCLLSTGQYFCFGYSLFLVPAFWLFENPLQLTLQVLSSVLSDEHALLSLYYVLAHPARHFIPRYVDCLNHLPLSPSAIARQLRHGHENAYVPGFMLLVLCLARSATQVSALCSHLGLLLAVCTQFTSLFTSDSLRLLLSCVWFSVRILAWRVVSAALDRYCVDFCRYAYLANHLRLQTESSIPTCLSVPVIPTYYSLQGFHDIVLTRQTASALSRSIIIRAVSSWCRLLWVNSLATPSALDFPSFSVTCPPATLLFFLLAWLGTLALSAAFLASKTRPQFLHWTLT